MTADGVEGRQERLMEAEEVADLLSVPKTWVYAASKRGLLPCVRVGRYVRFRRSVIEAWIEQGGEPPQEF